MIIDPRECILHDLGVRNVYEQQKRYGLIKRETTYREWIDQRFDFAEDLARGEGAE